MKSRRAPLPRLVIGDRVGAFEVASVHSRDENKNVVWNMACIECGMVCQRSQSTVNRWRSGMYKPPTTCEMAHDENGKPSRAAAAGGEYKGPRGPQSEDLKRRRALSAEARDTRPQRICDQCCGLTHCRPRKGPCKCGGRYAEERRPANDVSVPSSAAMCLGVG